jgi:Uma2 family endonuclease
MSASTLTLLDFLKLPETRPANEYINGRVVQKVSPKFRHSWLEGLLSERLNKHAGRRALGMAAPGLRCTFAGRSLVFDVSYFRADRVAYGPDGELVDDVFLPPDLAVEILSPGQGPRAAEEKLLFSLRNGVRLGWLIDPYRRRIKVFEPGKRPRVLDDDESLEGGEVVPGFRVAVKTVFGWLRKS